uniref:Hexosyltransferase n=1 Tax=Ailuropoda melanoleuca TaxID=9646 RepID=A0A7N5KNA6_AILME
MALALLTTLPSRMSLRSLKWSLLLLSLLSFLVMWYLSLPHYNVIERVNWMYFYEYEPVYRQDFRFTLREHSNCSHQNPFLVILVTSHPSDVKARQAIRVTWGEKKSWWGYEVLTFFLLGQQAEKEDKMLALSLEDEHLLYGDIIRQDFLDTYNNLTLKTIMAFRIHLDVCQLRRVIAAHGFSSKEIITFWQVMLRNTTCHY